MVPDELQSLVAFLKSTDLVEIAWERNGTKISLRRDEAGVELASVEAEGGIQAGPPPAAAPKDSPEVPEPPTIRSPMVGTFLRAAGAGRAPLVGVGSRVTPGQKVCVIEVMKILKDVTASESGRVAKVLVESGRPVEYGQPLFLLETEDGTTTTDLASPHNVNTGGP